MYSCLENTAKVGSLVKSLVPCPRFSFAVFRLTHPSPCSTTIDVSFRYHDKADWLFEHLEFGIDMNSRYVTLAIVPQWRFEPRIDSNSALLAFLSSRHPVVVATYPWYFTYHWFHAVITFAAARIIVCTMCIRR